jgi:hypothetical protein
MSSALGVVLGDGTTAWADIHMNRGRVGEERGGKKWTDVPLHPGKYHLADVGFPVCDELLTPYRAIRYHLAKWGHAGVR